MAWPECRLAGGPQVLQRPRERSVAPEAQGCPVSRSDPAERHPGARRLCSHLPGVAERPLGKAPPHLRRWPAGPIVGLERLHWKHGADTLEAHPASEQSLCCTGWSPYNLRSQFPLISALEARHLAVKIHCPGGLAGRSWS